jgi:gamma-glutamyl-gamma-aminobutyrate hydrolase PuuD
VEAIESVSEHFCVGLQWHPEKLGGDAGDAPFRALVEACQHGRQGDSRTRAISS